MFKSGPRSGISANTITTAVVGTTAIVLAVIEARGIIRALRSGGKGQPAV